MAAVLNTILIEKQKATLTDANNKLNESGKCLMIRPTGFGKTYLLIEGFTKPFIKKNKNKKVVYIYPLDIIKTEIISGKKRIDENGKTIVTPSKYLTDNVIQLKGDKKNMIFISYQELSLKFNENNDYWINFFEKENIGLVILDEAHRAGSETFYNIYDSFKHMIKPDGIRLVGATATPDRMDDCDDKPSVLEGIFDNIKTFDYTLQDALDDGIIPEPVVLYDDYTVNIIADKVKKEGKAKFGDNFPEESFNVELSRVRATTGSEDEVISKAIYQAGYNPAKSTDKYYKFIVFFTDIQHIVDTANDVEEWFDTAFNTIIKTRSGLKKKFKIRTSIIVSADTSGDIKNFISKKDTRQFFTKTKYVEEIVEEDYCVDILFTIDMINMGYHVENITGVMLRRGTKSEIVLYQQIGRAFSVSAVHSPIVIDCVANVKENAWFARNAKHRQPGSEREALEERKNKGFINIDYSYNGTLDGLNLLVNKYSAANDNLVEKLNIEYLYNNRKMPIYLLAIMLNMPLKEVVKRLIKYEIPIRKEDNELDRLQSEVTALIEASRNTKNKELSSKLKREALLEASKLRFINSKNAQADSCKYIKKSDTTLYGFLNKQ